MRLHLSHRLTRLTRLSRRLVHLGLAVLVLLTNWPADAAPLAQVAPADGVVGDGTPGSCTEAALAAALAAGGSVTFACGGAATITLTAPWTVTTATTVDGGDLITLSGGGTTRLFNIPAEVSLTLLNLTLADAYTLNADGGAIANQGELNLVNVTFRDNETAGTTWGAAVANLGRLVVADSRFEANQATDGGALYTAGVVTITNSLFQGNLAHNLAGRAYGGGAILQNVTGTLFISNTIFLANQTLTEIGGGGAISLNGGELTVVNSRFENNVGEAGGGALATNYGFTATITNTHFINNTATQPASHDRLGGAIWNWGPLFISASTFSGNRASQGGAIWTGPTTLLVVRDSTFTGNAAATTGGAVMVAGGDVDLLNSTLSGNTAAAGGGLYSALPAGAGSLALTHVTLAGNGSANLELAAASQPPVITRSVLAAPSAGLNCVRGVDPVSGGYNLASDASCGWTGTGDVNNLDPVLGPLNDNGGPTATHLPDPASPAVDAIPGAGCVSRDQRGVARPAGAGCDRGAVEIGGALAATPLAAPVTSATTYFVRGNALYWRTPPDCAANPPRPETIVRAVIQGDEPPRVIHQNNAACGPQAAASLMRSNLVADDAYLYWTTAAGLQRLSVQATPATAPQSVAGPLAAWIELAQNSASLVGQVPGSQTLGRVNKASGAYTGLPAVGLLTRPRASLAFGQEYLYWLQGGALRRYNPNTNQTTTLATGVVTYLPIGGQQRCTAGFLNWACTNYDIVLYSLGTSVWSYNNLTGQASQVHASTQQIYDLAYGGSYLYTLEEESLGCTLAGRPWLCQRALIRRVALSYSNYLGALPNGLIYVGAPAYVRNAVDLQAAAGHVFWREGQTIQKRPFNADGLPNVAITGLEITQGIQNITGTVPLIQHRQTFVRVFARTTHGRSLSGVDARLLVYGNTTLLGSLRPYYQRVRATGDVAAPFAFDTSLTLQPFAPNRNDLSQQFVFEVPLEWTSQYVNLNFVAEVNPGRAPYEATWEDNVIRRFVTLLPSPALRTQFVFWRYRLPGQAAGTPDIVPSTRDRDLMFSYLRRTLPLASRSDLPGVGLQPSIWYATDARMGQAVARDPGLCMTLPLTLTDNVYHPEICASVYSNQQMEAMRTRVTLIGGVIPLQQIVVPESVFMYGVISDTGAAAQLPRGYALGNEASGGAGVPRGRWTWDTDSNYGDWMAAHEIGHSLGLPHPATGNASSDGCVMYSPPDFRTSVPNAFARIGLDNNTQGFDVGNRALGLPLAIYPGDTWHDFMSYCQRQWISDWTYLRLYNTLRSRAAAGAVEADQAAARPLLAGPWLLVQGGLAGTDSGLLSNIERLSSAVTMPERVPGDYTLELRAAGGALLASYPFTPEPLTDSPGAALGFTHLITDVAGSAAVRLVRLSDNAVLAERALSPQAPFLSAVAVNLTPAGSRATLTWTASDPDGDPLTFDVFYSLDGGQSFMPVALGLASSPAELDTAWLAGGAALFQVVARDGTNLTPVNSAGFTMPHKAPEPQILAPAPGQVVPLGETLNLLGQALDPQTNQVGASGLTWTSDAGPLGTGGSLALAGLPLGTHVITLTAVNSYSVAASTSLTFTVVEDVEPAGPSLAVTPAALGFTFALTDTQPQTATLTLNNAGGGELTWAVASAPAWLAVTPLTGTLALTATGPVEVQLSADPTLLASYTLTESVLVWQAIPVDQEDLQTVVIRLQASRGLEWSGFSPAAAPIRLYLPLIRR